jgi:hypothetical protein
VLQEHHIEGCVFERQMQGIADLERDAVRQATALRQINGSIDEGRAQVDSYYVAAEGRGEIARWAADAAAEIQHSSGWVEPSGRCQLGGGEDASDMELIEWRELGDGQHLTFGRDRREC